MKNPFFLLLFLITFFHYSCRDDVPPETPDDLIAGTHLDIDVVKAYIPEELKAQKECVYVDESGNMRTLKVSYREQITPRVLNGQAYESDELEVTLYDESDPLFQIVMVGSANYKQDFSVAISLTVMLMPANPQGSILSAIRFDENGEPVVTVFDDFHTVITLGGKSFNDCFLLTGTNPDSYSEIYVNSEVGVVAFRDANNALFVFQEYRD